MKEKFKKTQNNDVFISPKWKNTILEMSLKSSILPKLDHQMSKIWIEVAGPLLETISNIDWLKNWDLIAQLRTGIWQKFLDSKYVLNVNFKLSRKNNNFIFLPVPILPGWLIILHLK